MGRSIRGRRHGVGKRLFAAMVALLAPLAVFADPDEVPAHSDVHVGSGADGQMAGIGLLLREMDCAYRHGDLAAAAALIDFPLVVMAATPDGGAVDVSVGPEEWLESVEPRFNGSPREQRTGTSTIEMITDSLAWIEDDRTTIAGPTFVEGDQRSVVVVRRRGKWLIKAIVGRGWPGSPESPMLARAFG